MKKIYIIFAIVSLFMVQLNVVRAYDSKNNVDLDPVEDANGKKTNIYNNVESADATTYMCGNGMVQDIPATLLDTVHIAYMVIQVVVPIILVVMGMITLLKSVASSKEDEIKKSQMAFVKKLISGALVFFIFVIVKLLISFAATSDRSPKIINCMDCFLNDKDRCTKYENGKVDFNGDIEQYQEEIKNRLDRQNLD